MRKRFLLLVLGILMEGLAAVEASPTALNTNLSIRLVFNTPSGSTTVRIAKDPRNNILYYLKVNGDIYQVNLTNSTSTKVYSSADHGMSSSVEGLAIGPDGTMYVEGDFTSGNFGSAKIMKGVISGGTRVWSTLMQTDLWPKSGGAYDHNDSEIAVSPDGQYIYLNAGSRTDHGEVEDKGGTFPNTRDVALTAKIFRLPTTGSNLFMTNDLNTLNSLGYVYAQGTRNAFDFAFNAAGEMFATDNGPDRDMSDSLYWVRQGCHYGFPWRMGGMDNPQQFSTYNPTNDLLLNSKFGAVSGGLYKNDPTFPAATTNFTDPVFSLGPDADSLHDTNGSFVDASTAGRTIQTFTAHSSPLGLVFDTTGAMGPAFQYHGFMLRWTPGDPTGYTVAGPFNDASQDLLDLNMTKLGTTNYQMTTTRIVSGFANPIDSEIINNKLYVVEYGGSQGLWEITFPSNTVTVATHLVVLQQPSSTATAGFAFAQQPIVAAQDDSGNTVTNYSTNIYASEISGGALNATPWNSVMATLSNGVGTFSGLFVTNIASNVTLAFTSGSLTSTNSSVVNVSSVGSSNLQVGVGYVLHITLVDRFRNVSHFTGTKMVTFAGGLSVGADGSAATFNGVAQGSSIPVSFSSGAATVTLVPHKSESGKTLTATDGSLSTSTTGGASLSLAAVIPGADNAYRITAAVTNPLVGASDVLAIKLVDQYQNPSTYSGGKSVTFGGLSAGVDSTQPTVNGTAFASPTSLTLTGGLATATLVAWRAESSKLLSATDGSLDAASAGGIAPTLSPRGRLAANTDNFARAKGLSLRITIADLVTNDTDDGDISLVITRIDSMSTNGVALSTNGTSIFYTNSVNLNANDQFTYTVADSQGGTAVGFVNIAVVGGQAGQNSSQINVNNGTPIIVFFGVPDTTYQVQRSTNLTDGVGLGWVTLSTTNSPDDGIFTFTDHFSDLGVTPSAAWYRLLVP